jgi:DUF1365 family protein
LDQNNFVFFDPETNPVRIYNMLEHIQASTYHARRGSIQNAFRYGVDYVLSDLKNDHSALLSYNRFNLWSIWDFRHGGERGNGIGVDWFQRELSTRGLNLDGKQLVLLTQPSFLWFHFNPVSFWIALRDGAPIAIIAEVNNTFGHRHCYFCANPDFEPIEKSQTIKAEKMMHVSPFQKVAGDYSFNFDINDRAISIRIDYRNGDHGVLATLAGSRKTASNRSLLWAAFRRPFGSLRVVALIHFQAIILYFKSAPFTKTPPPPARTITTAVRSERNHYDTI